MVAAFQQTTHLVLLVLGLFMTPPDKNIVYIDYVSSRNNKVVAFKAERVTDGFVLSTYDRKKEYRKSVTVKKKKGSPYQFYFSVENRQAEVIDIRNLVTKLVSSDRADRASFSLNNSVITLSLSPRALLMVNQRNSDVLVFYGKYAKSLQALQSLDVPDAKKCTSSTSLHFRLAEDSSQPGLEEYALPNGKKIYLYKKILLSQDDLTDAFVDRDAFGRYVIMLTFSRQGRARFSSVTSNNIGKKLAIVINNKAITAPVIMDTISSGKAQITGSFSRQEAEEIVQGLCLP